MAELRLTRPLTGGIQKIRDRITVKDETGKESYEDVFHVLGPEHSPVRALVPRKKKVQKEGGKKGEYDLVDIPGAFMNAKDANGLPVWSKPGKPFEVSDVDYVLKNHGAILEKVK